ncbi:MAG: DUF2203 family protein [Bdellovibrio sp.]|nr:MAG: DUF2203 family protein [Bdellovibrio sp.]
MLSNNIITIHGEKLFTEERAEQVRPIIHRFTHKYSQKVNALISKLESLDNSDTTGMQAIETEINGLINSWNRKVKKLGGIPRGLWIVDFDCGDGYLCWTFPEPQILYWHSYNTGYSQRIKLSQKKEIKNSVCFSV